MTASTKMGEGPASLAALVKPSHTGEEYAHDKDVHGAVVGAVGGGGEMEDCERGCVGRVGGAVKGAIMRGGSDGGGYSLSLSFFPFLFLFFI